VPDPAFTDLDPTEEGEILEAVPIIQVYLFPLFSKPGFSLTSLFVFSGRCIRSCATSD